jgi:hypothetical protein
MFTLLRSMRLDLKGYFLGLDTFLSHHVNCTVVMHGYGLDGGASRFVVVGGLDTLTISVKSHFGAHLALAGLLGVLHGEERRLRSTILFSLLLLFYSQNRLEFRVVLFRIHPSAVETFSHVQSTSLG